MNGGRLDPAAEWLEADGLGGFASGTLGTERTRRYHALLLAATTPPTGRYVLVNGFDAWVEHRGARREYLTAQRYLPDVSVPAGGVRIAAFRRSPWPAWTFRLADGEELVQELFAVHGLPIVAISWRLASPRPGLTLTVRPFLSGRDVHALHRENPGFDFSARVTPVAGLGDRRVLWQPYVGVPGIASLTNGSYHPDPLWYRDFLYAEERARGLDCSEDLASPGALVFDLSREEAVWIVGMDGAETSRAFGPDGARRCLARLRSGQRRRRARFADDLERAADAYLVRRGEGRTVVAGYPWFTDWGRDTFVAMRGLCLATGGLRAGGDILLQWADAVSEGMLPNRFVEAGDEPEFNSVDASLWFVVAVHEFLRAAEAAGLRVTPADRRRLLSAVERIVSGYATGTRYGIGADEDGLLFCGAPGLQLTWMDAKVGDWVVTPRSGKPVEVQALWLNALRIAAAESPRWTALLERGLASFRDRFWHEAGGHLHDVVDPDRRRGAADPTFRPNQVFAIGGLPFPLLDGLRARRVVDAVEARLWTPLGLRSLAPGEPGYRPRYEGGVPERDGAYHQGTVWPWLAGPFVEAWVRVRGNTRAARVEARERFLGPLLQHLHEAGLGHVSEIADGDPPHAPRGCPFQAWSVAELIRLDRVVLRDSAADVAPVGEAVPA